MAHQDFEVSALRPLGRHGLGFVGAKLLSPGLPAPTRSGRGGDGKCPKHFFFPIRMDRAKFIPSQCSTPKKLIIPAPSKGCQLNNKGW